jgi:hypothetical protein
MRGASVEGYRAMAARHRAAAAKLTRALNARLWRADLGYHAAWNVSSRAWIDAKTYVAAVQYLQISPLYLPYISPLSPYISPNRYVVALPLWASAVNASQAAAIAQALRGADMLSEVG